MSDILTKGPSINVHVTLDNTIIKSVQLSLNNHSGLGYTIEGGENNLREEIKEWLTNYAHKRPVTPLSCITITQKTPFITKVLHFISTIEADNYLNPLSYQYVAYRVGSPGAARAVGQACGKNPFPLFVPCHRVIKSDGSIGGFALDSEIKRRLLEFETNRFY